MIATWTLIVAVADHFAGYADGHAVSQLAVPGFASSAECVQASNLYMAALQKMTDVSARAVCVYVGAH